MNKVRVAIADDHDLVRQGMRSLMELEDSIEVKFCAKNGQDLLDKLGDNEVDIVLLDLDMPVLSGDKALPIITEEFPSVDVLIISMHYMTDLIHRCVANGAKGFLPKQSDFEQVVDAIHSIKQKGYYFDDMVSKSLLSEIKKGNITDNELTPREVEIIEFVCEGKRNKEIADILNVSPRTVEGHRRNISEKTNTNNAVELVIYAIRNGLFMLR